MKIDFFSKRFACLIVGFLLVMTLLIGRMVYLCVIDRSFLLSQGQSRYLRTIKTTGNRGMIVDRNNAPLAVSTPTDSIWVNPQDFPKTEKNIRAVSQILTMRASLIKKLLAKKSHKQFVYLKRSVNPSIASKIKQLGLPGLYLEHNFKRFYPDGEAAAHIVGFTNIDNRGESGLELAYNAWLKGQSGKETVLKDRLGHIVGKINELKIAKPGNNLELSIHNRIQFLAYRVLKMTVKKFDAESGSVVVLNPKTGEILAMANAPSFNPNNLPKQNNGQFRNRAVTDLFEPGSTMKAFSIASALDSGKYRPETEIDTDPGYFYVDGNKIHDEWFNHGKIDVTTVLQKSSNVGVAKMTLSLPPEHLIDLLRRMGFGQKTASGFPGESPGNLRDKDKWRPFDLATLAFGYGITANALQLTHAYAILANHGLDCPPTFLKQKQPPVCTQVIQPKVADEMVTMLESVQQEGGTGLRAKITGYKVAGKTGTAYIAGRNGYDKHSTMSSFVGIAPASDPALVVSVVIRKPKHEHYGALVAAPAFSKIMGGALNILNIPPDMETAR